MAFLNTHKISFRLSSEELQAIRDAWPDWLPDDNSRAIRYILTRIAASRDNAKYIDAQFVEDTQLELYADYLDNFKEELIAIRQMESPQRLSERRRHQNE